MIHRGNGHMDINIELTSAQLPQVHTNHDSIQTWCEKDVQRIIPITNTGGQHRTEDIYVSACNHNKDFLSIIGIYPGDSLNDALVKIGELALRNSPEIPEGFMSVKDYVSSLECKIQDLKIENQILLQQIDFIKEEVQQIKISITE